MDCGKGGRGKAFTRDDTFFFAHCGPCVLVRVLVQLSALFDKYPSFRLIFAQLKMESPAFYGKSAAKSYCGILNRPN